MGLLEVENLGIRFGGLVAVDDFSFHINQGEIVGLIGPNGAGKTTAFNMISGALNPTTGTIKFKGEDITGLKPFKICRKNMVRTFQGIKLFTHMPAYENVATGLLFGALMDKSLIEREVMELLEFVELSEKRDVPAKDLPIAEQKRLEIARALATKPELLMLDEVMAGLNVTEVTYALELIRKINREGITIFLIEHIMHAIMGVSDRIIVLHHGSKIAEGTPAEISNNKKVIEIYLGEGAYAAG